MGKEKIRELWSSVKAVLTNRWFKFGFWSILYFLWFVVWTANWWWAFGLIFIYDWCITKYFNYYVWRHYKEWKSRNRTIKEVMSWVEAILWAAVVASLVHTYVFQMYKIPSPSMEGSLLVGDYLYVSKITYGPKMPNTPLAMPLVHNTMPIFGGKSYSDIIEFEYKRIAGRRGVERGDIVVFNYPAGDTVLLEDPITNYYDKVREYEQTYGSAARKKLAQKYTIVSYPVDRRENYVKRAVGIPGDIVELRDGVVWVNDKKFDEPKNRQYAYRVAAQKPISSTTFEKMGISSYDVVGYQVQAGTHLYDIFLNDEEFKTLRSKKGVLGIERHINRNSIPEIFPNDGRWTEDNFGPLWIPKRGTTVELNLENLPLYRRIIEAYEGNELKVKNSTIYINGKPSDSYTFKMNYYFMMGDNRHNSADSRFWGFVPEDHIVGCPLFIWLSLDPDKSFPNNIRWDRMFKSIE